MAGVCWRVQTNSSKNGKINVKNICEIFYVVSVHMSGEILEYSKVWDDIGLMKIKVAFYFCLVGRIQ